MTGTADRVTSVIERTLEIDSRRRGINPETPLLGGVPELDSMAVVWVIQALEQEFGINIEEDEVSAEIFATIGALVLFVESKLAAKRG